MGQKKLRKLLVALKKGLSDIYGDQIRGVYLFGSYARGTQEPESDLDILIVLDDFENYASEIDRTGELISELSLQSDLLISTVFVRLLDWQGDQNPFLRNIRQEVIAA